MYKGNDVTHWLSQTTDTSKYFVWSPGLWDKESHLYIYKHPLFQYDFCLAFLDQWKHYNSSTGQCFTEFTVKSSNEPRHDKTNKMSVRLVKTAQPGHPPSLIRVFAVRMKKHWVLSYPLSTQRRLWSDWADAQADLNFGWAHIHFVGFVMSWLKYIGLISWLTIKQN